MNNHQSVLQNYEALVRLDAILNGYNVKYPFQLNEQATFTQHQISLYQANYCHTDSEPVKEQPSIEGGRFIHVVLL